jgi:uncharacterized membrane protein
MIFSSLFEIFETWAISSSFFISCFRAYLPFLLFFFFLHSPVSFGDILRGVSHGTMHGALFGGIDG